MYTDPGSGLFFTQVVIAAALSVAYRFRRLLSAIWKKRPNAREVETAD